MDTYERALAWLYSLEKAKGIDLELQRVARGLRLLGDPQEGLRCFHVAGTNGKGSVVAFLESLSIAAGLRVGAYTSPHLVELTERIRVCGAEIERSGVVALAREVRDRVIEGGGVPLTFFEVVTAMAFLHFQRVRVEVGAVEVGLGGRLDATNLIDPAVSVITTIGRDHAQHLGSSEREVAAEKSGIVKPERPVVVGRVGEVARRVIGERAARVGAPAYFLGRDFAMRGSADGWLFAGPAGEIGGLQVALAGAHQVDNAALALAAMTLSPWRLEDGAAARGLREVRWPARLQTVAERPRIVLDGAHNVDAMEALVAALPQVRTGGALHVLFAAMGDKDWPRMIDLLGPHCASAVATEVLPERAVPAERLARAFSAHCSSAAETDPEQALLRMRRNARREDTILVTGSLFLAGKIHEILGRSHVAAQ